MLQSKSMQKCNHIHAFQRNFKLCCKTDQESVSYNRNSTVIYEGGCQNMVVLKPLPDLLGRGGLGISLSFFWRVKQIVGDYIISVLWSHWKWCHMSKKKKVRPALILPHTFLSTPSVSPIEWNFFGSTKIGKGANESRVQRIQLYVHRATRPRW